MIYVLTVKQLSDKLNVSKQTINNNVPNDMSYKKIKCINYIDSELEIVITNNINRNKNRFNYDSSQSQDFGNENTSSNDELIKQLRSEIDTLSNQLSDLNSNDISYKGTDEVRTHDDKDKYSTYSPKKKSLLSRLFNK